MPFIDGLLSLPKLLADKLFPDKAGRFFSRPWRFFLVIFLAFILAFSIPFWLYHDRELAEATRGLRQAAADHAHLCRQVFWNYLGESEGDLKAMSGQHELQAIMATSDPLARQGLARDFLAFARAKSQYDQIRLLGWDGQELVRVNQNDGSPAVVPPEGLQAKGQRFYLRDAHKLALGQVYVSPLDLNLEQGRIERPFKPVLRLATPLPDREGRPAGLLIINVLGEELFRRLRRAGQGAPGRLLMCDSRGYWLLAPQEDQAWGSVLPERKDYRFGQAFPQAWRAMAGADQGQVQTKEGLFAFVTVQPGRDGAETAAGSAALRWKIVYWVSAQDLWELQSRLWQKHLLIYLAALVVIAVASWLLSQALVRRRRAEQEVAVLAKFPAENPNPVLRASADCRLIYANPAGADLMARMGGREGGPLPENLLPACYKALKERRTVEFDLPVDNGHYSFMAAPVHEREEIYLYGRDVSDRVQAEQELRKSEAGLREAQRIARMGSWEFDIATGGLTWSHEIFRIFGLSPQEFAASYEAFLNRVHPDDRQLVQESVDKALKQDQPYSIEHRIILPGGGQRIVHEIGEVVRGEEGQPLRMVGTVQDITESKQAENQIALASRVFENSVEGVVVTDPQGTIQMVNAAFTTITGYTAEEAVGQNPRLLKSDRQEPAFYEQMWRNLRQRGAWSGEIWNRRKDGEAYPEWLNIVAFKDSLGRTLGYVSIFHDLSDIKRSEQLIKYQTYHDALTGLPNRTLLQDRLGVAIQHARAGKAALAVAYLDIDHFRHVNDSLGHTFGDLLLQQVAERLKEIVGEEATISRYGGDEFVILLEEAQDAESAVGMANLICASSEQPFSLDGQEAFLTWSVGIAVYPADGQEPQTLIRNAELAMYRAKEEGGNNCQLFAPVLNENVTKRLQMENRLRRALQNNEFVVYYQAKVDLVAGRIMGMEALARWQQPSGEIIGPDQFIPLAEETGLIIALGSLVLRQACQDVQVWRRKYDPNLELQVAVNLSARQFRDEKLTELVRDSLQKTGLPPQALQLEITESLLMADAPATVKVLKGLQKMGVRLGIDDFGTGYSSMAYLRRFPIESLKVDKSFVDGLPDNPDSLAIVRAIITLAHSLGLKTVAEGVETKAQVKVLQEMGCDQIQGYYFSKPQPAQEFDAFLQKGLKVKV
ncbi:MAG: EAL domain-containing protein [Thermodesulfobacteriota bacterium]